MRLNERMTSMDGVAKHRTERGSAGSNKTTRQKMEFDPALPRSVLCLFKAVHTGYLFNNFTCSLVTPQTDKLRVPQVIALGPFRELDLCDQPGSEPLDLLHHFRCHSFATARAGGFG